MAASTSQNIPPARSHRTPSTRRAGTTPAFTIKKRFDDTSLGFKSMRSRAEPMSVSGARRGVFRDLTVRVDNLPAASAVALVQPQKENEEDLVLVMGSSGAGKTSFINLASGSRLPVNAGLKSCTTDVSLSEPFMLEGRRVRFIDTPGFDDSSRSDADVLATISEFLAEEFKRGKRVRGILYFHRISDVRMGALSKRNFGMFQKLCGEGTYPNVVLVTSRWSEVNEHVGAGRENELKSKAIFFKPILEAGASLLRYTRTIDSAYEIIRQVLDKPNVVLDIQREMVVEGKSVAETSAGLALQSEKLASIQKFEENLRGLTNEIEVVRQDNDTEAQKELESDVVGLKAKVRSLQEENSKLISRANSLDSWVMLPSARNMPKLPFPAEDPPASSEPSQQPALKVDTSAPRRWVRSISSPQMVGAWRESRQSFSTSADSMRRLSGTKDANPSQPVKPCSSNLTWEEWLFGFPSGIYLTVSYLLGGIIGPLNSN